MDAVEFLKERTRMCNFYMSRCMNCPGNKVAYCATLCANAIDLVPIVEQWSKEHPVKTRQSEFLKMFPEASMLNDEYLSICPAQISSEGRDKQTGGCYDPGMDCGKCKRELWLAEIKDGET